MFGEVVDRCGGKLFGELHLGLTSHPHHYALCSDEYEKTLLKLQKGSQRDVSLSSEESTNTDTSPSVTTVSSNEASMVVDTPDYASTDSFSICGSSQSIIIAKEEPHKNLSVLDMFSRYKTSRNDNISSCDESTMMEDDCSSANAALSNDTEPQQGCIVNPPSPI
ncbi:hypothetical protein Tco_0593723 [Tanacetum coccineum]